MKPQITKHLSSTVKASLAEVVFTVGEHQFSKDQLVNALGIGNFTAARRLSRALRRLKIKTPLQLFNLGPFSLNNTKGVGDTQLMIAMCYLDWAGFSVNKWWDFHVAGKRKRREKQAA